MTKVLFPAGVRNVSPLFNIQIDSGTHPAYYQFIQGAVTLEVKRPGHEAV